MLSRSCCRPGTRWAPWPASQASQDHQPESPRTVLTRHQLVPLAVARECRSFTLARRDANGPGLDGTRLIRRPAGRSSRRCTRPSSRRRLPSPPAGSAGTSSAGCCGTCIPRPGSRRRQAVFIVARGSTARTAKVSRRRGIHAVSPVPQHQIRKGLAVSCLTHCQNRLSRRWMIRSRS
jgi:hypothetical protein